MPALYILLSLALLAPCYWQSRIQAGDLSSHIYNSWLAQLIESGRLPGLIIVPQTTNILFDWILSGLFQAFGMEAAQRVSVGVTVLIFIWGAFAFAAAVSGRRPWNLLPVIAMLAYGWVFHMGLFNFYLALGLCFWAMAMVWRPTRRRALLALALLLLAYTAHALPVIWVLCLVAYAALFHRGGPRRRAWITMATLGLMVALRAVLVIAFKGRWYPRQLTGITGADQVGVFDDKYSLILTGLLAVWGFLFFQLIRSWGARRVYSSLAFQFILITVGGVVILPSAVSIPGFQHALAYIAERMSLGIGVCVCALLASVRPRPFHRYVFLTVASAYFLFLYVDERALNRLEDSMAASMARLEPGQRLVSLVYIPNSRVNAIAHMIDRQCVGKCFSYANYEPATWQFRVRALRENPVVVSMYRDSRALQDGGYFVKSADVPLLALDLDESGQVVIRNLQAGTRTGITAWRQLPRLVSVN